MGPLLRANVHRCAHAASSSAQHELRPLQFPEMQHGLRRLFGANAVLEETRHADETAGPMANQGGVLTAQMEECLQNSDMKQESATGKPSPSLNTDELTRLILEKMKSKNNIIGQKKNENTIAPKKNETPTQMSPSLMSQSSHGGGSVKGDKWQEVLSSMQKMASKNGATSSTQQNMPQKISQKLSSCGSPEEDDFADLDGPQPPHAHCGDNGRSKASSLQSDASKSLLSSNKQKGDTKVLRRQDTFKSPLPEGVQGRRKDPGGFYHMQEDVGLKSLNPQFKSKEVKPPTSFGFLDGPDFKGATTTSRDISRERVLSLNNSSRAAMSNAGSSTTAVQKVMLQELKDGASFELEGEDKALPRVNKEASQVSNNVRVSSLGHTICIRNVPGQISLALVKETLLIHGEIVSWYKKYNQDGTYSAYIEFKLADAMDSALACGGLQVDNKTLGIARADPPISTVVRVSRVGCDTIADQLSTICNKFGDIDNIRRRGHGVFDVFYKVDELPNMPSILERLNASMLNNRRLVALPAPVLHPAVRRDVLKSSKGHEWHALQMSELLQKIEGGLDTVAVCFEDLKGLSAMEEEMAS